MLAGVACGVFRDYEESVERCVRLDCMALPDPENVKKYEEGFVWYKKVHDALAEVYHERAQKAALE